jgi:amino acid transporter
VSTLEKPQRSLRPRINSGFGRFLIFLYALFALSASSRGLVELATKHEAPLSYALSALAGLVYIIGTICLARSTARSRRIGIVSFAFELVALLAVGVWTLVDKSRFPEPTVWSDFGFQYAFVPLAMPIFGLYWLWRAPSDAPEPGTTDDKQP